MSGAEKNILVVRIEGRACIDRADRIVREILSAFADASQVMVDISGCDDIDLSFIQILYAARAEAACLGKEFHLTGSVPIAVRKRLRAGGFLHRADVDDARTVEKDLFQPTEGGTSYDRQI